MRGIMGGLIRPEKMRGRGFGMLANILVRMVGNQEREPGVYLIATDPNCDTRRERGLRWEVGVGQHKPLFFFPAKGGGSHVSRVF